MASKTKETPLRVDQLSPHDPEAEAALLGCVLINPAIIPDIDVAPEDFFIERHGWVWEAALALQDKADYMLVAKHLEDKGRLAEAGGAAYVLSLSLSVPSILNADGYAARIRSLASRRRMLDMASALARMAHSDDQPIDRLMEQASEQFKLLSDHAQVKVQETTVGDFVKAELERADVWARNPQRIRGYRTGIVPLDQMSTGLQAGELTLLAARPGMGKSALLAQMAAGLAQQGTPVLVFSLEMTTEALYRRMVCQLARVNSSALREGRLDGGELGDYYRTLEKLSKLPIYIVEPKRRTVEALRVVARKYTREHDVKVVMVDTADKLTSSEKRGKQYEVSSLVSGDLAAWAHDDGLALIAAKQVNREAPTRQDKCPSLTDIRDSGAYEQDADNVWALHRAGYYDREAGDEAIIRPLKARESDAVALNRDVVMRWRPGYTGFEQVAVVELNTVKRETTRREKAA